ncbi:MAG: hypothetical protein SCARUB_04653 [Candidatus Scalindua rubra]|uniref:Uncharacterized protein n=1 Tax=Candidatus Scalindua rubra TaxID=1872076 RepID=A0A1E3X3W9_9BACT|nr:MAG: hypothetical protein SCARUB_04653 [Candidatus Scalindua rubra]
MKVSFRLTCICVLLVVAVGVDCSVSAREFRSIKSIPTPKALPEKAEAVAEMQPVDRKIVEKAVNKLMGAWNKASLEDFLGEGFFDKSRLVDAIDDKVPRDASLRILSIQGIQTLTQNVQPDASGREWVVSTVSATVKTQLEFNDATRGFQRREGVNEYIFRVRQKKK